MRSIEIKDIQDLATRESGSIVLHNTDETSLIHMYIRKDKAGLHPFVSIGGRACNVSIKPGKDEPNDTAASILRLANGLGMTQICEDSDYNPELRKVAL